MYAYDWGTHVCPSIIWYRGQKTNSGVLPQRPFYLRWDLYFVKCYLACEYPRILLCWLPISLYIPVEHVGLGDLNSGLHAFVSDIHFTYSSPQLQNHISCIELRWKMKCTHTWILQCLMSLSCFNRKLVYSDPYPRSQSSPATGRIETKNSKP